MKVSYHQYSRYASLKPDISYGVVGLSQILMNHAVKELLLKKNMLQMDLRGSDGLLRTSCKVQGRTTW